MGDAQPERREVDEPAAAEQAELEGGEEVDARHAERGEALREARARRDEQADARPGLELGLG